MPRSKLTEITRPTIGDCRRLDDARLYPQGMAVGAASLIRYWTELSAGPAPGASGEKPDTWDAAGLLPYGSNT